MGTPIHEIKDDAERLRKELEEIVRNNPSALERLQADEGIANMTLEQSRSIIADVLENLET